MGRMTERRDLGDFGERLAAAHLEAAGYRIIDRNWRNGRLGEIDLVAVRDGVVAFVEVRTRKGDAFGPAIESLTPRKQARLLALADAYVQSHEGLPAEARIDVVAVDLAPDGRLLSLEHVERAVEG